MKKSSAAKPPLNPAIPAPETRAIWIYLSLFVVAVIAYAEAGHFQFVNYDDPFYVSQNVHVREGLSAAGIEWAFTSTEGANWFPITRLSHLLDATLFGMDSGWHHLTNVLLHALSTVLLFAFLLRATGARLPSAFVAAVFALHPLHVESVAWVSERKDVLSAFFWMLALWAYVRYTERPDALRYLTVLAAFSLGLMSKPMIVTFPILLLLLDYWPLGRKQLVEKIPFVALSGIAAVTTFLVQHSSGAVKALVTVPLGMRIENALVSYAVYIAKMFWPAGLAVFYPYPLEIPAWQSLFSLLVLALITLLAVRSLKSRPYLAVGWSWYLVTLAPVIGIVQVGGQARADRYMYVPMIGLTIMLAWGAVEVARLRFSPRAMATAAAVACAACLILTWRQAAFWTDSVTLFQHAVDVTERNDVAEHNLGSALLNVPARLADAIPHLQAAVAINPNSAPAYTDLGSALAQTPGRLAEAVAAYQAALRINPDLAIPHNNLGLVYAQMPGRTADAVAEFQTALRVQPDYTEAANNLKAVSADSEYDQAMALAKTPGRLADAIAHFEAALRLNPNNPDAHNNLGFALTSIPARLPEAISHFEAALRISPQYADAHYNLGAALSNIPGRMPEAIAHLEAAQQLKPDPELEQLIKRLRKVQ